jgi:hypothetical protein
MVKIELAIREELVKMIDDRKPAAEIEAHVQEIKTDLEVARAIVTPEFPTAIIAIVAAMAILVAMARFKGTSLFGNRPFL